jgi:hypothetical protein
MLPKLPRSIFILALLLLALPATAQRVPFGGISADSWAYGRPTVNAAFPACYDAGGYDRVPCSAEVEARAVELRAAMEPGDPVRYRLLSEGQREKLVKRASAEVQKRIDKEAGEHPERTAPAAWAYRSKEGKLKGDMGLSLSLFARPSKVRWLKGRWVTLGAFLGKASAGFGVAWELTPHRIQVEGAPRKFELWGGPVAVTPWGSAGDLSLSLGIGFAARM